VKTFTTKIVKVFTNAVPWRRSRWSCAHEQVALPSKDDSDE